MSEETTSGNGLRVAIRLLETGSALLAKADVAGAKMNINGFSVMRGKEGIFVTEPAVKQGSGWLKVVEIHDKNTAQQIKEAVISAYNKAVEQRQSGHDEQDCLGM